MKSQLVCWPMMFTRLRCRLNVKLKLVVLSCAHGFRNNYMLHSVYFRSLVDLENKSCVRVPPIVILPECELNHCCRDCLKKALQMVCAQFHSNNFHKAFEGLFLRCKNIQTLHQALWWYIFTSGTLTQLLFSKSTNDLKETECSI